MRGLSKGVEVNTTIKTARVALDLLITHVHAVDVHALVRIDDFQIRRLADHDVTWVKRAGFDQIFCAEHSALFAASTDEINRHLEFLFTELIDRAKLAQEVELYIGGTETVNFSVFDRRGERIARRLSPVFQ